MPDDTAMPTAREIWSMPRRELLALLRAGHPIAPHALDDAEYRGTSLGLPRWVEAVTWKTFKKAFHRDPADGALRGWNVRLEQRGVDGPSVPRRTRAGAPVTFGHFAVVPAAEYRVPHGCNQGLMLDYGRGGNGALDATALLRDPLVAVNPGDADLLLGWSYLDLGLVRVGTPSFFTLERDGALSWRAEPPRRRARQP